MRDYELALILKPTLTDEVRENLLGKIKKLVEDAKGQVASQDLWGKKPLAYPIKHEKEGVYVYFAVSLPRGEVSSLERKIKIEDGVLRLLLVKKE